jgi:thiazole synthase
MSTTTDILIIGGGVVGLAIAIELKLRGAAVTVLSRNFAEAATHAAAGMLAPQAEAIANPALLDLCLKSRMLYPDWVKKIEATSGLTTGYWPCGILAPAYERPQPGASQIRSSSSAVWLDQTAIHSAQPGLSAEVIGGFWFPEDGQVDNRALAKALKATAQTLEIDLQEGVTVKAIQQQHGQVTGLKTTAGEWQAEQYVLATGAWSSALLPVPVQPRKGQMLSVRSPSQQIEPALQRVLFGSEVYIVPRRDGRIAIGATSESVGFTPGNTPAGLQQLLTAAIRLYPALQDLPIEECWWGFRPTTPDESPILGSSLCPNLTLAVGHHRNGILLAPVTALLIADSLEQQHSPLLQSFSWERFYNSAVGAIAHPQQSIQNDLHNSNSMLKQYSAPLDRLSLEITPEPISNSSDSNSLDSNSLDQPLVIAGRSFQSRLMTGTGKYRNFEQMRQSIAASGCEIVTVAVRRVQTQAPGHEGLAEALDWKKLWMLPNTAGCKTAEEAIRVARLGREMAKLLGQEDNNFVKLEVIPDAKYLLPDPIGTLEAAEQLVKEGFAVLPYINADPLLAQRLEEVGCATVMPLGSPIGSGQGIKNEANIQIIVENANIPVVVDAGIGTPSEAAQAMEMGADALLINTAIAQANNPALMGKAMGMATESGRLAYLAGRIPVKTYAIASSPLTGTIAP